MDLDTDQGVTAVVRSVVTLAAALNRELLTEGVQTFEQAQLLGEMQSREPQGFFCSRPVPAISFEKLAGLLLAEAPAAA